MQRPPATPWAHRVSLATAARPWLPGSARFPPEPDLSGCEEEGVALVGKGQGCGSCHRAGAEKRRQCHPGAQLPSRLGQKTPGPLAAEGPQSPGSRGTGGPLAQKRGGQALRRQDSHFIAGFQIVLAEPGMLGEALCAPPVVVSVLNRLPKLPLFPAGEGTGVPRILRYEASRPPRYGCRRGLRLPALPPGGSGVHCRRERRLRGFQEPRPSH
ncbi:hypothetical protein P7K49_023820 [Saguinus oedipus]|uniref:Uncharacterized protein n=1 Tax=Saguinus oedipus TaxID=9490 RepID=A0ABQ9UMU7_SAGOE|nr:hypothetical protein P7K49_023820 [Saguinus oedipus]